MAEIDPVTTYATDVVQGREVAGVLVRQACQRHLDDLARPDLVWKPEKAQRVIGFFADVLFLPENTDAAEDVPAETDQAERRPFILQPWQQFIAGSLFGWYTPQGFRRYREAYIEAAKGCGKTPFGAGLMIYLLVADGERGAQVFSAANTLAQAKDNGFRDAVKMVEASPYLSTLVDQKANNLAVLDTGSFFRPISAEKRGLDGKRVHGALIDELHEHVTAVVNNKMRAGTKGRRNALIVKTTNSGYDRASVCWHQHEFSRKVLQGTVTNDTWFAFVCGLDPCEACRAAGKWFPSDDCPNCDDWKTEGPHWRKACPNLGVSLPWQYVRERVSQALGMPSLVSDVLRFNFCVWTQAQHRFIDMGQWQACLTDVPEPELLKSPCYGGLDLGQSDDFAAFALVWQLSDGRVYSKVRFWIPRGALVRYPDRPYDQWERESVLEVTEGNSIDYTVLRAGIAEDCLRYGVIDVAYDPRFAEETAQYLAGEGVTMIRTAQGFHLNEALVKLSGLLADRLFGHDGNTVLGWMASNAVVRHGPEKRIRLDKESAPEKIDGIAALADALDRLTRHAGEETPEPELVMW